MNSANFFIRLMGELPTLARCEKKLGHLSEKGGFLNGFCYMLWDTTLLSYDEESKD